MDSTRTRRTMAALVGTALAGALLTAIHPGTATAGSGVHRPPATIDATGSADVTSELQRFLDGVPDDAEIEFPAGARYRVEGTLVLEAKSGITIRGNGATTFATTRGEYSRSHWRLVGGSDLTIRNLAVIGAHPDGGTHGEAYVADLEAQHGVRVEGTQGLELDRVVVEDVYGDFVYLGRDEDREWSSSVWIHDSTFRRNGRQGIAITAGRDVVIERNKISETRRATFDLEPNTPNGWGAQNIHILDNEVGAGRLLFVASHGDGPVDDVVVSGNRLRDKDLTIDVRAPGGQRRSNWVVTNNSSTRVRSADRLMRFTRVDGLLVADNQQRITDFDGPTVELNSVCGAEVEDNAFGADAWTEADGASCPATLRIPAVPEIPAREAALAAATPPTTSTTRLGPDDRAAETAAEPEGTGAEGVPMWTVGVVAALAAGLVAIALWVRRRRAQNAPH